MKRATSWTRAVGAAIAAGLLAAGCAPEPEATPPTFPDRAALSPSAVLAETRVTAGAAFVIEEPGYPPVALTALHNFGPTGGLTRQITAEELPKIIRHVEFYDMFSGKPVCAAGRALLLPAAPFSKPSIAGDVAAFVEIKEIEAVGRLRLSNSEPAVGQWVWLLSQVAGGAPIQQALHKARIDETPDEGFFYAFENPQINLTATSGAPVLNSAGEVLGIHLSHMKESAVVLGFAHRAAKLRQPLLEALKADAATSSAAVLKPQGAPGP